MKRQSKVILGFGGLAAFLVLFLPFLNAFFGEMQCRKKMKSVFVGVLGMYCNDHNQNNPDSLFLLADWFMNPCPETKPNDSTHEEGLRRKASIIFGKCPCSKTHLESVPSIDQWGDYVYVPWAHKDNDIHGDYPLAYERRVSNHFRRGVNVVLVDGTVFWDSNARYIKRFSELHPSFELYVPQD